MTIDSGSALFKAIIVAAVAVFMLIPLGMLRELVNERTALRTQAVESVARGWGGRQLLAGPIIAVPVTVTTDSNKARTCDWYVLPESLQMEVALDVPAQRRKVGMYEVQVYSTKIQASARFDLPRQIARLAAADGSVRIHMERARVLVPVSDARGVREISLLSDQVPSPLEPTRAFPISVLAAPLPPSASGPREVKVSMVISGTESLAFVPLARSTEVHAAGNWPHPGFTSGFLPTERRITKDGFEARWQVLDLNRNYHPIEYGLMALALAIFYLLLLALAEHIGFAPAYFSAALALCALIGAYLSGVLRSPASGWIASGIFAAVYGLLYLLVTAEDYSLLAGALALFALLATVMLLTRKVNWYGNDARTE